jgi:hypothetical protein
VLLGVLVALGLGAAVARWQMGLREVAIFSLAMLALLLFVIPRPQIFKFGFFFWIATFLIGWRQIWITSNLKLHPSEVLIWFLFGLMLLQDFIFQRQPLANWLPTTFVFFIFFCVTGLIIALFNNIPWDVALAEAKAFLVVIPIFYVTRSQVRSTSDLRTVFIALVAVVFLISALGLFEYTFPSVTARFPGYFAPNPILYSEQGFPREDFTFYGGAGTSIFLTLVLLLNLALVFSAGGKWQRVGWSISCLVVLAAIYVSGSRAPLVGVVVGLGVFILFDWRRRGFLVLVGLSPLPFLPERFYNNMRAVVDPYQYYDTSVLKRRSFFEGGLNSIWRGPLLGNGWGSSGWVHSDLVQLAANLGVPAFILFLLWYLGRMWGLWRVLQSTSDKQLLIYTAGLLGSLIAALICLSGEAIYVLPQLIIPIWFVVALADVTPQFAQQPA